ncbi:conserved hypothetical integral membrane protein [Paraoerskovia marina]|uniref:Conserved hypothetical integral membrane protein n=1 Tax=Paraoerskovia marina TaxID=545619 RepID=A0A1H1RH48_9CELL|nr:putative sulfate exporter family transporter [Paraoerskovia marina]SDS35020.1 conserved hypothetical integral membrane protein [Paraoerskovia marina]
MAQTTRPGPAHLDAAPRTPSRTLGILAVAVASLAVISVARFAPTVSPMVIALAVGAIVGSALGARSNPSGRRGEIIGSTRPGTDWVATKVLRLAVILLGIQLSIPDLLALGWEGLAIVLVTVTVTFTATLAIARLLKLPRVTGLLVATGFSICGAAAASAMKGVVDDASSPEQAEENDDAMAGALALVTIYGSLAIVVLPWLADLMSLNDHMAGLWIGVSTQEVAQVVAAAGTISTTALATATVAKLARVALLAPLVTGAGIVAARRHPGTDTTGSRRRVPIPGFVIGFVIAVLIRSTGILPDSWITVIVTTTNVLFVASMFAMGLNVDLPHLLRTGRKVLLLGFLSACVVTVTGLLAVLLLA